MSIITETTDPGHRPAADTDPLLRVRDLRLDIPTAEGTAHVLRGIDLEVEAGSTLGVVGESGSGKSMLLRSVLGLTPGAAELSGDIRFDGHDLTAMAPSARRRLLGRTTGVVFQNPMTSLNPVVPIARQMGEASRAHLGLTRRQARTLSQDLLEQVGIPHAAKRLDDYPHQFSGGMRQRVMIAMALTCEPKLLVADEATTALDVTIQKEILDLLQRLQAERGMTMILVSHDLSVVAGRTDNVVVMYGGRIVERKPTAELFAGPHHPYTEALLRAIPRLDMPAHTRLATMTGAPPSVYDPDDDDARDLARWTSIGDAPAVSAPPRPRPVPYAAPSSASTTREPHLREGALLSVEGLECSFRTSSGTVDAVRGISFDVLPGETLGLVGESGCGKTTTGRAILQLPAGQRGSIWFDGHDLATLPPKRLRTIRSKIQMIFQDPLSAFNPRRRVIDIVGEGLAIQGLPSAQIRTRVAEVLDQVGISAEVVGSRRPHEFSGGQCQRLSIARSLAVSPELLVCDEPVASLDVSVQARVLNVLQDIRERHDLSMVFISHDLAVVRIVSDRIAVMYRGKIVEIGDAERVYSRPAHPYTRRLINAVPVIDEHERPDAHDTRAEHEDWATADHPLREIAPDHYAAIPTPTRPGGE